MNTWIKQMWKQNRTEEMNLKGFLVRLYQWSQETFGPGKRVKGITDHMKKEIEEIKENPEDLEEYVDLMMLSFDGAMRQDYTPREIIQAMHDKLDECVFERDWPDWREMEDNDQAIEHIRK